MEVFGVTLSAGAVWALSGVTWGVSVLVSYRLGAHQARAVRHAAAAATFRAAIHQAAASLPRTRVNRPPGEGLPDWYTPVRTVLAGVSVAALNYRPYLPLAQQREIDVAWGELSAHCEYGIAHVQNGGDLSYSEPDGEEKARKHLITLLGRMARFAGET